jgi:hypothetical protein
MEDAKNKFNKLAIMKPKYENSSENLLEKSDRNEFLNLDYYDIKSKMFFQKTKTSIFGNFYRNETLTNNNNEIKNIPQIKHELKYSNNSKKRNTKKNFICIPTTLNDLNIDDNNKKKSLNPIFLTELFAEFDKRTLKGKITYKITIIHRIIIFLIFIFLIFEIIVHYKSRNLTDKILEEEKIKIDIRIEKIKKRKCSQLENTLRIFNLLNVILCEIILIKRELYLKMIGASNYPFRGRIFDFIFIGIFFPPFINPIYVKEASNIIYFVNLSNLFFCISLFKIIFFLKYSSFYSKWNNSIAKNISKTLSSNIGHLFVLQCRVKEYSFIYLIVLIISSIFFFSILLRTTEYLTYNKNLSLKNNKELYFDSFLDSFWTSIMMSFGVCYGDIYPRTTWGRIVSIITTISGYILISKLFVTLMNYLVLTQSEKKVFIKMKRLNSNENQFLKGIKVIRDLLNIRKYLIIREKESENKIQRIEAVKHILILLLFLNNDSKNFIDFDKIDESYTIPVDDILKEVINKIEENLKSFELSFNKLAPLNSKLSELMNIQNKINENLNESIIKQRYILNYLINLNNNNQIEKFKSQFFTKKHCSGQNNSIKVELDFKKRQLSDKLKLSFSGKNRLKVQIDEEKDGFITGRRRNFKLNYNGNKSISEKNNEDSSISNSPFINRLKNSNQNLNNFQLIKEPNEK